MSATCVPRYVLRANTRLSKPPELCFHTFTKPGLCQDKGYHFDPNFCDYQEPRSMQFPSAFFGILNEISASEVCHCEMHAAQSPLPRTSPLVSLTMQWMAHTMECTSYHEKLHCFGYNSTHALNTVMKLKLCCENMQLANILKIRGNNRRCSWVVVRAQQREECHQVPKAESIDMLA